VVAWSCSRWSGGATSARPIRSLRPYRAELLRAVAEAEHVLPGRTAGEEWFYADGIGPSRWLKIVVAFASDGTGRIITAFARRRKP
jgi:hypothetical protein